MREIVPSGTHIDFLGRRHIAIAVSLAVLAAGVLAGAIQGVKFGIDFVGGTEMAVRFDPGVDVDESALRNVVGRCGVDEPSVVRYGDDVERKEFLIKFKGAEAGEVPDCPLTETDRAELAEKAEKQGGDAGNLESAHIISRIQRGIRNDVGEYETLRVDFVGPRVGSELTEAGVQAMTIAVLLILAYIAFRFSSRFAPGAVVALVHDVGITCAVFVIFGLEFDLRVLAALLAILGYSLNDTIIIYDRIRENMEIRTKYDLLDVLNRSVNQTLSRTLLTSVTTLAAVLCLLFLGGEVIRPFALAMAIGIVVGTYSSTFIAAPTLLFLETRFGDSPDAKAAAAKRKKEKDRERAA
ncbi:MAG: protein translocase subunit SecF [Myxococcota bacterium]